MSDIHDLLKFDGLAAAEEATGRSYKEDEGTMLLGMLLSAGNNAAKDQALKATNDTRHSMGFEDAVSLYEELGFEVVHRRPFTGTTYHGETPPEEQYLVLWHPDGLLATAESYGAKTVNSTNIYYNIQFPSDAESYWDYVSSGCFHRESYDAGESVWVGHHDARQGLRVILDRLRTVGSFRSQWIERPFLWLLSYSDREGDYDYEQINEQIISELPEHVRAAITPKENE